MNAQQLHALTLRQTDVTGAVERLCGSEELYESCLSAFRSDSTMKELNEAIAASSWDEAFTAAHAMKGMAGNMGFVPLMHSVGQLIVLIRGGRLKEISESLEMVNSSYRDIMDGINRYFALADEIKGEAK